MTQSIPITQKHIRKVTIRMMLRRKSWKTTRVAHRVAWLVEERGIRQVEAKRKASKRYGTVHSYAYAFYSQYLMKKKFAEKGLDPNDFTTGPLKFSY